MKHAVIFSGQDSLNFMSIRNNIIRIPEVYRKIQEAQKVSDDLGQNSYFNGIDFSLVFLQDDEAFKSNLKLKNILLTLVQLGLYERFTKKLGTPRYIIGDVIGETTANIVAAFTSFRSLFIIDENPGLLKVVPDEPILSGSTMGLNQIYDLESDNEVKAIYETKQNIDFLVQFLIEEESVKSFVNIGPGLPNKPVLGSDLMSYDIQVCESIDVDPMLSWFWPVIKTAS